MLTPHNEVHSNVLSRQRQLMENASNTNHLLSGVVTDDWRDTSDDRTGAHAVCASPVRMWISSLSACWVSVCAGREAMARKGMYLRCGTGPAAGIHVWRVSVAVAL